ncbi:response regulator transcription factor [Acidothermaceae bacterium B102]|nr:response regulator transcription factor [Acidothermaceae bacterium B102]
MTTDGDSPSIRVAAIDDDTLIREGLGRLTSTLEIVASYATAEAFLHDRPDVDVVLLDLNLAGTGRTGGLQGGAAVAAVAGVPYRVLIYTNERRRQVLVGCLAAGARGIVHKAEPMAALEAAAHAVAGGEVVITDAIAGLVELVNHRGQLPTLTPRERDVLRGRARGESFSSIGARLYISPKTAQEYMTSVTGKFGDYLRSHSPADLERHLGFAPGDLLDWT